MSTVTYITGAVVRVAASFASSGLAIDPGSVVAKVRQPDGTTTTYTYGTSVELIKDAAGTYHLDVATTQDGRHKIRWTGAAGGDSAAETAFFTKSAFV